MEKNNIFTQLDASLVQYFKSYRLTQHDFYCTLCNTCLVDINDLKLYRYISKRNDKKIKPYFEKNVNGQYVKIVKEPIEYRWILHGKYLTRNNKTVFRHVCWNCFFDQLFKQFDVQALGRRKKKWWKRIADGNREIPKPFVSCSPYFQILFYLTDEELKLEQSKLDTASKDSFISKYGETEGINKYEQYVKRQAYTCSKEYMMHEKGMSEQQWNEYNKKRSSTKENFILRYGIERGTQKWNDYCKYESYAGCKLQYFIDKYGEEQGLTVYKQINAKKAVTEENLIKKYGEELGKAKFNKIIAKRENGYSEISQELFNMIDDLYYPAKLESKYASKNSEAKIFYIKENGVKSYYCLDYTLGNKVIEFYGDLWHANPNKYKPISQIKYGSFVKNANEIWQADSQRIQYIQQHGFKVKIIWESEFSKDKIGIAKQCVEFLKT